MFHAIAACPNCTSCVTKRIQDTREPHQPAPVVLPKRTTMHVAERMRLIRQGDSREIATLEAALKQGKGLRPWRLATDNPDLFHPARLMREEEERLREKVLQAAGINLGTTTAHTNANNDKNTEETCLNHEKRAVPPPQSPAVGEEGFAPSQQANNGSSITPSPGLLAAGKNNFAERQQQECVATGGGGGGGGGGDGRVLSGAMVAEPNFDVESDVQKRVLDLVGTDVLDRLHEVFCCAAGGRLGRTEFISALCVAHDGVLNEATERTKETGVLRPGASLRDGEGVSTKRPARRISAATTSSFVTKDGWPFAPADGGTVGEETAAAVGSKAGMVVQQSNCAPPTPRIPPKKRSPSAQKELVTLFGRLFDLVSLKNADWATWGELSNFLLFDGETPGRSGSSNQGSIRAFLPTRATRLPKIVGLASAIVFKVSRGGQDVDVVALLIRHSPCFMVLSLKDLQTSPAPPRVKAHLGQVLAAVFVPPFNVLVTSGEMDRMIKCWDIFALPDVEAVANNKRQAQASEPQIMLRWLHRLSGGVSLPHGEGSNGSFSDSLVSGGAGGTVNVWRLTAKALELVHSLVGHTGALTSVCMVPHPEVVVTGAMDADIRVWETSSLKCKRVMKGHSRGVVTIEYSPSQRIIVSAGFDHDILVWSPVAGQVICRLVGHSCSLVAARVSVFSSDVISMSVDGIIKVWDAANFKCVQTIHANTQQEARRRSSSVGGAGRRPYGGGDEASAGRMRWGKASNNKNAGFADKNKAVVSGPSDLFLFEGETSSILVCQGRDVVFYENGQAGEKDVTDSNQTIDVVYHAQSGTFGTVASTGIKLWDARTGKLTRAYAPPRAPTKTYASCRWKQGGANSQRRSRFVNGKAGRRKTDRAAGDDVEEEGLGQVDELTSACVDPLGRQLVMGFNTGRVTCVRYLTGRLVDHLDCHRGEVTDVVGVWNDEYGALALSASDPLALLQKMADDVAEPRRTMVVLDPGLATIRMERFKQVVHGSVTNVDRAIRQINIGTKVVRAKRTFMTAIENLRDMTLSRDVSWDKSSVAWSGAGTSFAVTTGDYDNATDGDTHHNNNNSSTAASTLLLASCSSNRAIGLSPPRHDDARRSRREGVGNNNNSKNNNNNNSSNSNSNNDPIKNTAIASPVPSRSDGPSRCDGGVVVVENATTTISSLGDRSEKHSKGDELRPAISLTTDENGPSPGARQREKIPHAPPPDGKKCLSRTSSSLLSLSSSSSCFRRNFAGRFLRSAGRGGGGGGGERRTGNGNRYQRDDDGDGGKKGEGLLPPSGDEDDGARTAKKKGLHGRGGGGAGSNKSRCGSHITCIAVSDMYQLAATGCLNGNVIVWDVQKGPSTCGLGVLKAHNGYQVNSICFLEPHAALVTCNLEGMVAVWRMGPVPDPRKSATTIIEDSNTTNHNNSASTTTANKKSHEEDGVVNDGGGGGAATMESNNRAGQQKRRRNGASMPPCSTWRCVTLFYNNNTAPTHVPASTVEEEGDTAAVEGVLLPPVPSAVNSLAWSSVEQRLFTGDADGFVKVWDIIGALTWEGVDSGVRTPTTTADGGGAHKTSATKNNEPTTTVTLPTTTAAAEIPEKNVRGEEIRRGEEGAPPLIGVKDEGFISPERAQVILMKAGTAHAATTTTTTTQQQNETSSAARTPSLTTITTTTSTTTTLSSSSSIDNRHNNAEDTSRNSSSSSSDSSASSATAPPSAAEGASGGDAIIGYGENYERRKAGSKKKNGSDNDSIGGDNEESAMSGKAGAGSSVRWRSNNNNDVLWPSEPSQSIDGEDCADRFGRGLGLRFIRRLDEWRPGREGRQEVIKVKVFEDQNVMFKGVSVGGPRPNPAGRRRPLIFLANKKTSTVIVATITPDKLVRFWTSGGVMLGSLDQEHVASPHPEIAARPLDTWRLCVARNEDKEPCAAISTSNNNANREEEGGHDDRNTGTKRRSELGGHGGDGGGGGSSNSSSVGSTGGSKGGINNNASSRSNRDNKMNTVVVVAPTGGSGGRGGDDDSSNSSGSSSDSLT